MQRRKSKVKVKAKRYGFTLAEMLVVVVIISLIASLGGGIYIGTYKRILVEKAARNFLLAAKYARIMAIEQQSRYEIHLDQVNNGFLLSTMRANEESGQTEKMIVRDSYSKPVQFDGNVRFEGIQITPFDLETSTETEEEQIIVFSPNGTADSAVIQIGDEKTHYTISVCAATGKAKIYTGTAENIKATTIDLDAE